MSPARITVRSRPTRVSAAAARRLLLSSHGLLVDPATSAGPASVERAIERLGFVQVDTINVVERAHHHILMTRFDGYRPETLRRLLEHDRRLFEHWTHDAAVIPSRWLPFWTVRFERWRQYIHEKWWHKWAQRLGGDPERMIDAVRSRIEREGPLRSKDFETDRPRRGSWWNWKPAKVALEYLWRTGELAIARREGFEKVYDLAERVFPEITSLPVPEPEEHAAWACGFALERLGVATASEVSRHLLAVTPAEAARWLGAAGERGEVEAVEVESADGSKPRAAWALAGWKRRMARLAPAPRRMRLLSPFEPTIRDRDRTWRLFGYDYRLECFVPAAKRRYGYYVLPLLEGERLVGRVDPKLHRDRGVLEVRGPWWEPGVDPTRARVRRLEAAIDCFSNQLGAERWTLLAPPRQR
jgi:uncharacterized protein YcaQ